MRWAPGQAKDGLLYHARLVLCKTCLREVMVMMVASVQAGGFMVSVQAGGLRVSVQAGGLGA